jgi:hypothetical protein
MDFKIKSEMKVVFTDSFWKSLDNIRKAENPWYFKYWEHKWYDFKHAVKMLWVYFPMVVKMRDWGYAYMMRMMRFQLKRLRDHIEKYSMATDEFKYPKIESIDQVLEYMDNHLEDKFLTEADYDKCETEEESFRLTEEINRKDQENWDRMFAMMRANMRSWWD